MRTILAAALLLAAPALAQGPQSPPATSLEQALYAELTAVINDRVQLHARMIDLQRQLDNAQARLRALEEKKPEPPAPPPK